MPRFDAKITDQKRLVRGEQLLAARSWLRLRDRTHQSPWKVMCLPGGEPQEEINALRDLMKQAHITAVDTEADYLEKAKTAGVDQIIQQDLSQFDDESYSSIYSRALMVKTLPPQPIRDAGPFDLIILDLCSNPTDSLRRMVSVYEKLLTPQGVMVVTFSYGRDVVEVAKYELIRRENALQKKDHRTNDPGHRRSIEKELLVLSEVKKYPCVAARLARLFTSWRYLMSVMVYQGSVMPMASVLQWRSHMAFDAEFSFIKVSPGDFELAVTCPDPSLLYAVPQERIEVLRRSHTAIKASYTRASRKFNIIPKEGKAE